MLRGKIEVQSRVPLDSLSQEEQQNEGKKQGRREGREQETGRLLDLIYLQG
jgi:hypothetical protein